MAEQIAEVLVSAEEYLVWECAQPTKHELLDNRIIPMTGASRSHNFIGVKLASSLDSRLSGKGCEVYVSDMRVQVEAGGTYTYPDVVVVCGEPRFMRDVQPDTLLNPTLVFEILSPSTEMNDRAIKLGQYLRIPSLLGCFLVAQDKALIEAHLRDGDEWVYEVCEGMDSRLVIDALECEILLRDVYAGIQARLLKARLKTA